MNVEFQDSSIRCFINERYTKVSNLFGLTCEVRMVGMPFVIIVAAVLPINGPQVIPLLMLELISEEMVPSFTGQEIHTNIYFRPTIAPHHWLQRHLS